MGCGGALSKTLTAAITSFACCSPCVCVLITPCLSSQGILTPLLPSLFLPHCSFLDVRLSCLALWRRWWWRWWRRDKNPALAKVGDSEAQPNPATCRHLSCVESEVAGRVVALVVMVVALVVMVVVMVVAALLPSPGSSLPSSFPPSFFFLFIFRSDAPFFLPSFLPSMCQVTQFLSLLTGHVTSLIMMLLQFAF